MRKGDRPTKIERERERDIVEDRLLARIKFAFRCGDSCLWGTGSVTTAAAPQFSELAVCCKRTHTARLQLLGAT